MQDLWGNPGINSGGGLWDPPSFDSQGNLYIGIANPGPIGQDGWPKGYPWGTSRPGPDLYTDSVVKLSPQGKLLWYYQLTPHDLFDWDLQNSPVLTTANGQPVVIDGGKAGILIELNAQTGKLLWKLPVGVHSGPRRRRADHRKRHADLAHPAAGEVRPRARRVRRRRVPAGDQRLDDVRRCQQPRRAAVGERRGRRAPRRSKPLSPRQPAR